LDERKQARRLSPAQVAEMCLVRGGGLVLSGGEPFAQAAGLAEVCRLVRAANPDVEILAYTGFELPELLDEDAAPLLRHLDVLVDGPFVRDRLTNHPLIGSDNQRILLLSKRVSARRIADLNAAIVQLELSGQRRLRIVGTAGAGTDMHALVRMAKENGLRLGGRDG
jgi:organic radical activating enzyme